MFQDSEHAAQPRECEREAGEGWGVGKEGASGEFLAEGVCVCVDVEKVVSSHTR